MAARSAPAAQPQTDSAIGGTAWIEPSRPSLRPAPLPKEPSSFLDMDDLDEPASNKKPLLIALVALAFVAIVGIVIFFAGGSKKDLRRKCRLERHRSNPPRWHPRRRNFVKEPAPAPEPEAEKPAAPEPP